MTGSGRAHAAGVGVVYRRLRSGRGVVSHQPIEPHGHAFGSGQPVGVEHQRVAGARDHRHIGVPASCCEAQEIRRKNGVRLPAKDEDR